MKNDFDFIKDKIEESGVKAPENMDENFVLKQLEGVSPKPVETEQKPRVSYKLISGLAAGLALVVGLSVFTVMHFTANRGGDVNHPTAVIAADIPLHQLKSYQELDEKIDEIDAYTYTTSRRYEEIADYEVAENDGAASGASGLSSGATGGSAKGSGGTGASDSYSETYLQVAGVDEADIVKTDGRYLYVAEDNAMQSVAVYTADESPRLVTRIFPGSENPSTPDTIYDDDLDYDIFIEEMYLTGDKLVVICFYRGDFRGYSYSYNTKAYIYDISDMSSVKYLSELTQSGTYDSSRMVGDMLYVVSSHGLYGSDYERPVSGWGAVPKDMPADCIYYPDHPNENDLLIIGGFNIADGSSYSDSKAMLGGVENIYCSGDNLYMTVISEDDYRVVDDGGEYGDVITYGYSDKATTGIYKVSLSGGVSFTAYGEVEGYVYDRYALDERDGYLRVATTSYDRNYDEENNLYVLDSNLAKVGEVTGFAKTESIKAVRYVGSTAYVITYEQTDPLFVIDLSDPAQPTILGEVKISGFSSMLVPIDDNTVLGLGYLTMDEDYIDMEVQEGFKIALFDVSDKTNPRVLDEKEYLNYYSPVMSEPRALVYNADRDDYVIPLNFYDYSYRTDTAEYVDDSHGGMLNFKVENGKIVEEGYAKANSEEVDRCAYVGDNIYMIARPYYENAFVEAVKYP